jgi:hypothetical protein
MKITANHMSTECEKIYIFPKMCKKKVWIMEPEERRGEVDA